ncbi:MAG: hypothetical protein KDD70_15925 [Bdellovibrionales bacterium]|nr:hypothetical protein [Bdellovibrionales bacterium]
MLYPYALLFSFLTDFESTVESYGTAVLAELPYWPDYCTGQIAVLVSMAVAAGTTRWV